MLLKQCCCNTSTTLGGEIGEEFSLVCTTQVGIAIEVENLYGI